jgi:isoquinoline 1-oxidoreductase alpha subunit
MITLEGNQKNYDVEADPNTPLLWVVRDYHWSPAQNMVVEWQCGVCTIHVNGTAVRSCQQPVSSIGSKEITTIEVFW